MSEYLVWIESWGEDRSEARAVAAKPAKSGNYNWASNAEEAAEMAVDQLDHDDGYLPIDDVVVEAPDGTVTRWSVSPIFDVTWSAVPTRQDSI